MKFTTATTVVGALLLCGIEALTIDNPFNLQQFLQLPKLQFHDADKESSGYDQDFDSVFAQLSAYFNEPVDTLTEETRKLWSDVVFNSKRFGVKGLQLILNRGLSKGRGAAATAEVSSEAHTKIIKQLFSYLVSDEAFPNHQLGIKSPRGLEVDTLK